jgi:hypothetical protein
MASGSSRWEPREVPAMKGRSYFKSRGLGHPWVSAFALSVDPACDLRMLGPFKSIL